MSFILTNLADGVFTIAFNRPQVLNALTPEMLTELIDAIKSAEKNPDIKVIILQGEGRAFCAGVDLELLKDMKPEHGRVTGAFEGAAAKAASIVRAASLPIIAKVHGACFTGALELALHCDFIFTTQDTRFGDTHCKWGLRPTWGMSQNLARAVGVRRARELTYTARTFTGKQAAAWGLANEAAEDQAALDALINERARAIAANSPGAVSANKKLYRLHEEYCALEDALEEEVRQEFPEITDTVERLKGFG